MLSDTYKLLASVTVVRELYDANKGIYDVLEEFINEILTRKRLYSFSSSELTELLNTEYSFQLDEAVIKTCLKRMRISKRDGVYSCSDLDQRGSGINSQIEESENKNKELFKELNVFLEKRLKKQYTEVEKKEIRNLFCDFLLQDTLGSNNAYTQFFHEFVLSISDNVQLMDTLNNVKEGTLIYEGIRYSGNLSEVGSWKTELNLILDTEILFAIGDYNSVLYQDMYSELEKYLEEINRGYPVNAPKIRLSYFLETKQELDAYFDRAERIVAGLDVLDPTKEAMSQIVNNCYTKADVQTKKSLLLQKLKGRGIFPINRDFYDLNNKDNNEYNLESQTIIDKYSTKWNDNKENIYRSIKCLSHVNILRKGISDRGFENCEYIFLTATGRTLKLARVTEYRQNGNVPLATTFDFLINRFWFKLNKGFGSNRTPRTMNMVMRARHILATIINNKASEKYDEFKEKYEQEKITKEEFCALNNDLRSQLKTPQEVDKDTIGEEIDDLDKWNFENILENQKRKELELNNANEQLSELQEVVKQYENTQKTLQDELNEVITKLDKNQIQHELEQSELKSELIKERELNKTFSQDIDYLKHMLEKEQKTREDMEKKDKWKKYYLACSVIFLIMFTGVGIYIYGSVKGLAWATAVSAILEISALVFFVISKVKKIKPQK